MILFCAELNEILVLVGLCYDGKDLDCRYCMSADEFGYPRYSNINDLQDNYEWTFVGHL
jgi:hypothetical protein